MRIISKKRRKATSRKRRTAKRNPTPKRRRRVRRNLIAKVNPMKKRKRRHAKRNPRKRRSFHRVKRNPSAAGIAHSVTSVLSAGAGGVAVVKLSNMIGTLTGFNTDGKKNVIKLVLTLAASYLLPKYVKSPLVKSFTDGMGAVTAISFVQTATGANLLSGTDDIQDIVDSIDGYTVPKSNMLGYTIPQMNGYDIDNAMLGNELDQYSM